MTRKTVKKKYIEEVSIVCDSQTRACVCICAMTVQ